MIVEILNILSSIFIMYDTVGYIAKYSNKDNDKAKEDYNRLILTWVFFAAVRGIGCLTYCPDSECFLADVTAFILAVVKLYLALPITGGVNLFKTQFIDNQVISKTFGNVVQLIKAQVEKLQGGAKTDSTKQ